MTFRRWLKRDTIESLLRAVCKPSNAYRPCAIYPTLTDSLHTVEEEQPRPRASSFDGAKLAPSEAVLLYADRFSTPLGPAWFGREKLLRTEGYVSSAELSCAVWMAALLSLESMGCIRFNIHPKVSLLPGRDGDQALSVALLPSCFNLPLRCLERRICRTLSHESSQLDSLVYRLLEQEGWQSRFDTLRLVKDGLLERGLLTIKQARRLGPLGSADYKLVRRTLTMVPGEGLEEISVLLNSTEIVRPAPLSDLRGQIGKGLARARYIRAIRAAKELAELAHGMSGLFH